WRLPSLGLQAQGGAAAVEQLQQAAGQVSISRLVHVGEHEPFVVALYDVGSRLGGARTRGPGPWSLGTKTTKPVELPGTVRTSFPVDPARGDRSASPPRCPRRATGQACSSPVRPSRRRRIPCEWPPGQGSARSDGP